MKRLLIVSMLLTLAVAGLIFFPKTQPAPSNQPDPTNLTRQTSRPSRTTPEFWDSALVPDPGEAPSVIAILPEDLGITTPTAPVDPQALIAKALSENNLPAIQSAALSWFQQDPSAARDWLATQSTFEDLQPAISYIAASISEKGDLKTAIDWVKILPEGTLREDTLFNIHALALRNRQITFTEIDSVGFSPDRMQELQSGAGGD